MLNLKNPNERQMYFKLHQKQLMRTLNNDKTPQENFIDIIKEKQEIIKYLIDKNEIEKDIEKQIENDLPKQLEKSLSEILKYIKK